MYYVSRVAGMVALLGLGVAVWFSIVLARADFYFRAATPENVQRATEIAPRNTEYLAMRALQLEYEGADSTSLTEKIARLNPYSSAPRIRLGLAAEIAGDRATAERWLLDAAEVDHQFEPNWALANFYFRAGDRPDEFWKWMRAALAVSYGDRTAAYDLCWRVSSDAEEILRRGIPDRHEVVGSYLVYLSRAPNAETDGSVHVAQTGRGAPTSDGARLGTETSVPVFSHTGAMPAVARRLAGYHDRADLPLLFGACDQLITARDPAALEVWLLTGRAAPVGIFNGDFETVPINHGFDWRLMESPGVTHVNGNRVVLSGQQAESCSLLQQTLSLAAGKHYRLHWEARTAGIQSPSGLEWRVGGQHASLLPSEDWTPGELTIDAAERFNNLELAYQRPFGESRAEGNVELRHLRLIEAAR
jgi:hypothetical protein